MTHFSPNDPHACHRRCIRTEHAGRVRLRLITAPRRRRFGLIRCTHRNRRCRRRSPVRPCAVSRLPLAMAHRSTCDDLPGNVPYPIFLGRGSPHARGLSSQRPRGGAYPALAVEVVENARRSIHLSNVTSKRSPLWHPAPADVKHSGDPHRRYGSVRLVTEREPGPTNPADIAHPGVSVWR